SAAEHSIGDLLRILHAAGGRDEGSERRDSCGDPKMNAGKSTGQFTFPARVLHWSMAAMILAMLFIGVAMVASLASYHTLGSITRPRGIAILVLVVVRFAVRLIGPLPPFLATMSARERRIATWSEYTLYALMFALPLVGWAMLSAARYPIAMWGSWHLPP